MTNCKLLILQALVILEFSTNVTIQDVNMYCSDDSLLFYQSTKICYWSFMNGTLYADTYSSAQTGCSKVQSGYSLATFYVLRGTVLTGASKYNCNRDISGWISNSTNSNAITIYSNQIVTVKFFETPETNRLSYFFCRNNQNYLIRKLSKFDNCESVLNTAKIMYTKYIVPTVTQLSSSSAKLVSTIYQTSSTIKTTSLDSILQFNSTKQQTTQVSETHIATIQSQTAHTFQAHLTTELITYEKTTINGNSERFETTDQTKTKIYETTQISQTFLSLHTTEKPQFYETTESFGTRKVSTFQAHGEISSLRSTDGPSTLQSSQYITLSSTISSTTLKDINTLETKFITVEVTTNHGIIIDLITTASPIQLGAWSIWYTSKCILTKRRKSLSQPYKVDVQTFNVENLQLCDYLDVSFTELVKAQLEVKQEIEQEMLQNKTAEKIDELKKRFEAQIKTKKSFLPVAIAVLVLIYFAAILVDVSKILSFVHMIWKKQKSFKDRPKRRIKTFL